ncbi:MAG: helix-turn-helix domain-containing protein [Austwickia sp.]|nr:helix-turn-helix domain-containing protein [Austwickia sp.]
MAPVARRLGVSAPTVLKWRDRFLAERLDGLEDAPRPGQPRKLTDEQLNALITHLAGCAPEQRHALVDPFDGRRSGLNQTQVSRIWRAFGLKPNTVQLG